MRHASLDQPCRAIQLRDELHGTLVALGQQLSLFLLDAPDELFKGIAHEHLRILALLTDLALASL